MPKLNLINPQLRLPLSPCHACSVRKSEDCRIQNRFVFRTLLLFLVLSPVSSLLAQTQAQPDILIFTNGDRLTGTLERSDGSHVTFKADMAGEISIDWSKVKELRTNRSFAVVPKGVDIKRGEDEVKIPQGTLDVENQQIHLSEPGAGQHTIPVNDSAYVIDQQTFVEAVTRHQSWLQGVTGSITLGSSLVEATQSSNTVSGSASLVRVVPDESWLDRSHRSALNVSFAYGKLTQPDTPEVKTDIYHVDAERDQYFTSKLFAFGAVAFDHNFSQGLDLQQQYGGGIGWTVIKNADQELDLRAGLNYLNQQFQTANLNENLVGSTFAETYMHRFDHNVVLTEQGSGTPTWNNTNAYSAVGQIQLTLPVYKRFSLSLAATDNFINNPPEGFKKNSVQFTTGVTYSVK
jgi:hypothetical protein